MRLSTNLVISLLSCLSLSGCLGGVAIHTVECDFDYPITDYTYTQEKFEPCEGAEVINFSKDDFRQGWGTPDEIVKISDNKEVWVYNKKKMYCGLVPMLVVAVPLVLPTCEVFDEITFENDFAVHVHLIRITSTGAAFGLIPQQKGAMALDATECPSQKNHDDAVEKERYKLIYNNHKPSSSDSFLDGISKDTSYKSIPKF